MKAQRINQTITTTEQLKLVPNDQVDTDAIVPCQSIETLLVQKRISRTQYLRDLPESDVELFKLFHAEQILHHYIRLGIALATPLDLLLHDEIHKFKNTYTDFSKVERIKHKFIAWILEQDVPRRNTPIVLGLVDFALQSFADLATEHTESGIISHIPSLLPTWSSDRTKDFINSLLEELTEEDIHSSGNYQLTADTNALRKAIRDVKGSYLEILKILNHLPAPLVIVFLEILENDPHEIINNDLNKVVEVIRTGICRALKSFCTDNLSYSQLLDVQQHITNIFLTMRRI